MRLTPLRSRQGATQKDVIEREGMQDEVMRLALSLRAPCALRRNLGHVTQMV